MELVQCWNYVDEDVDVDVTVCKCKGVVPSHWRHRRPNYMFFHWLVTLMKVERSHRKFRKQNHSLLIRLRIKTFQKCLLQITILEAVFSVRSSNNLNSMIHNKVSNIPLPMKMNFWLFMFAKEEINLALSFDFFHTEKSLFSTILDTEKCKKRQGTINYSCSYRMRWYLIHACSLLLIINNTRKCWKARIMRKSGGFHVPTCLLFVINFLLVTDIGLTPQLSLGRVTWILIVF